MRLWSKPILGLVLLACSARSAPMWANSAANRDFDRQQYRRNYDYHLAYLRIESNAEDSRQILLHKPLEVSSLQTYLRLANEDQSEEAKLRAVTAAARHAHSLGKKIKKDIQGPLHPDNVEKQNRAYIYPLQAHYATLITSINSDEKEFARSQLLDHVGHGQWIDYANFFNSLVDAAATLIVNRV